MSYLYVLKYIYVIYALYVYFHDNQNLFFFYLFMYFHMYNLTNLYLDHLTFLAFWVFMLVQFNNNNFFVCEWKQVFNIKMIKDIPRVSHEFVTLVALICKICNLITLKLTNFCINFVSKCVIYVLLIFVTENTNKFKCFFKKVVKQVYNEVFYTYICM